MMNNDLNARVPYRPIQTPNLVTEASIDPALGSLFEFEKGFGKMTEPSPQKKRIPSQMNIKKNK
ncbi:MAG: hypothetical protein ACKOA8_20305 [Deltaproteobacteria bacterium]